MKINTVKTKILYFVIYSQIEAQIYVGNQQIILGKWNSIFKEKNYTSYGNWIREIKLSMWL